MLRTPRALSRGGGPVPRSVLCAVAASTEGASRGSPSSPSLGTLKGAAKQPTIGQLVDDAMAGIERDNPSLKGVLPKDYARPAVLSVRWGLR